jgi:hypothetical protein
VVAVVGAAAAVVFIAAMAITGGRRENQQLVKFEAAGLMSATPQAVDRVDVEGGGRRLSFVRAAGGTWVSEGDHRPLAAGTAEYLETSLRFMHVAAPVRVMERAEWEGTPEAEFGLDPAVFAVRLSGRGRTVLGARFGRTNPQQVLQYARVEGREQLYLMPTFVAAEWEKVWERAAR